MNDFDYLGEKTVYVDAACQSLRPKPVVEALTRYYFEHNSRKVIISTVQGEYFGNYTLKRLREISLGGENGCFG